MTHSARYQVTHETYYEYAFSVSLSKQRLHLQPRQTDYQTILQQAVNVEPLANESFFSLDSFNNPCLQLEFNQPHESLKVTAMMMVDVFERPPVAFEKSMPWDELVSLCRYQTGRQLNDELVAALPFCFQSPYIPLKHQFADYALPCFSVNKPIMQAAQDLMAKIFNEFSFDPKATDIGTSLLEVLEHKRGVCQDYAHFMLACLRSLGMPARYVSGYLLTHPPQGQPRLIGADASHAWVAVYCPYLGWIDFDPTNNIIPSLEHITLAWGRDFSDVSPLRGVIFGGGEHELTVSVTVMPLLNQS